MSTIKLPKNLTTSIVASLPIGVFLFSKTGEVVYANQKAEDMFGYSKDELLGHLIEDLVPSKYGDIHRKHQKNYMDSPTTTSMSGGRILVGLKKNGEEFKLQIGLTPLEDHVLVSAIESTNKVIRPSVSNDPLTGLPNRQLFDELSDELCSLAARNKESVSVIFLDLDEFKSVNDQFGHDIGDLVVREVARLLTSSLRDSDVVARIGGDEFVVSLYGVKTPADLQRLSDVLISKISSIGSVKGHPIDISASLGAVITHSEDRMRMSELIVIADRQMYNAKAAGKGAAVVIEL